MKMMKNYFSKITVLMVLVCFFICISPSWARVSRLVPGEKYNYKISWKGQIVGRSKFFVAKRMSLAGKDFYKIESLSELKIGMGNIQHLNFASQITLQAGDLRPTSFTCLQKDERSEYGVDCLISKNLVAQKNVSGQSEKDLMISLDAPLSGIYMNNLWGHLDTLVEHYWILLKTRKTGKFNVYDPVLQDKGQIELIEEKPERIKFAGRTYKANVFVIKDFSGNVILKIWADYNDTILKMQEPGGGLTFELTKSDLSDELKNSPGVDVWKDRISHSNVFFPNVKEVKTMKVEIKVNGRDLSPGGFDSPGFSQKYEVITDEEGEKGVFEVKTLDGEVKDSIKMPVKETFDESIIKYTHPEIGIESEDNFIKNKAMEITWKMPDVWKAAQKVNSWVSENIASGVALPSAKMTLINEQGNSESKALLAIALCRSVGIPARKANGVVFSGGSFIPHYWFEVYMGKEVGWVPFDPFLGESSKLGATHIRLSEKGEIWDMKAKVLDFSPKPPRRVTYINRELVWPVGEERVYQIKKKGQKIGDETVKMEEIVILDETESYRMSLKQKFAGGNGEVVVNADYWMTPQGLPLKYEMTLQQGTQKEKRSYRVADKKIYQSLESNGVKVDREIPVSQGLYFADADFLSQWALIAGQLPDLSIGKSYEFTVFRPDTLTIDTIHANVKKFEPVEVGEKIYDAFRVDTDKNVTFWVDKTSKRVVKISFKVYDIDLELEKADFAI